MSGVKGGGGVYEPGLDCGTGAFRKGPDQRLPRPTATRQPSTHEIGVMVGQCLDRRIPDMKTLISEVAHWEHLRER